MLRPFSIYTKWPCVLKITSESFKVTPGAFVDLFENCGIQVALTFAQHTSHIYVVFDRQLFCWLKIRNETQIQVIIT